MKNLKKIFGIIAMSAVIGLLAVGCDTNSSEGSGKYTGKDVLGNSYSLSVGSDASRSAVKGDRYSIDVTTRGGEPRTSRGTIQNISQDGTLTLKPDGNAPAFYVMVDGTTLDSVAGSGGTVAQLPLSDGTTITPRTFDTVYLRATRWESGDMHGENWGSHESVLERDFPTNVSSLKKGSYDNRYQITVSGISDQAMQNFGIEVFGLTQNNQWETLGASSSNAVTVQANQQFSHTFDLHTTTGGSGDFYNLMNYKEIILQVVNIIQRIDPDHPDHNIQGSIPADIPDGQVMATISDLNISLVDTERTAELGNMGDWTFGFHEDGLSIDYRKAVWNLSGELLADAKKTDTTLEFVLNVDVTSQDIVERPTLAFIWQDEIRGLYWEDEVFISEWSNTENAYVFADGVSWDSTGKKMTIELSKVIKNTQFASSGEVNFIIACWWFGDDFVNIEELEIADANIVAQ